MPVEQDAVQHAPSGSRGVVAPGGCRSARLRARGGSSRWCWWPAHSLASSDARVELALRRRLGAVEAWGGGRSPRPPAARRPTAPRPRPGVLGKLRPGDTVVVWKLDRLGRAGGAGTGAYTSG